MIRILGLYDTESIRDNLAKYLVDLNTEQYDLLTAL